MMDSTGLISNRSVGSSLYSILVVDDDQTSLVLMETILHKEGFVVYSASSGQGAREKTDQVLPDLIIMDINMLDEDGLSACRKFKANARTAGIPVIFISAIEDVTAKVEGFQAGGVDYITKPFYPAEVLARVRLHIRMSRAYHALAAAQITQVQSICDTQQMLMPSSDTLPEAKFYGIVRPCYQAGGDFFDVLQAGDGIFDYLVADVSGHDLGTALPTAALKVLIHQNVQMLYSPKESLLLLNHHLRPVLAEGQHVTLLYARLNRLRRKVTLVNAGHPSAIIVRHGGEVELLSQTSEALGFFDLIEPEVREEPVKVGDRLFLYTDGLIEQDRNGGITRRQGLAKLMEACDLARSRPVEEAVGWIIDRLIPQRSVYPAPAQAYLLDDVLLMGFDV